MNGPSALFMFLSVGAIAVFSFVAVAAWSDSRRREREAFYRSETLRKIAESPNATTDHPVLQLFRDEQRAKERKQREGLKLGGMINVGVGVGLMVFLYELVREVPVYLVGLIPLLVGVALLTYAVAFAPKET